MKFTIEFTSADEISFIENRLCERGYPDNYLGSIKSAINLTNSSPDQVQITAIGNGYSITIDGDYALDIIELFYENKEKMMTKIDAMIFNSQSATMCRENFICNADAIFGDSINDNISALYCYVDKYDMHHYTYVKYGEEFDYENIATDRTYHIFIARDLDINYNVEDAIHEYNMSVIKSKQKEETLTDFNLEVVTELVRFLNELDCVPEYVLGYMWLGNTCKCTGSIDELFQVLNDEHNYNFVLLINGTRMLTDKDVIREYLINNKEYVNQ